MKKIQSISIVNRNGAQYTCVNWRLLIKFAPGSTVVSTDIPLSYNGYQLLTTKDAQLAAEEYLDNHYPGWQEETNGK